MDQLLPALKAAGEATRLRLLALCAHMDLTVTQLTQILGQSQPRVSRHLKLLTDAGLLERNREGSWVLFRVANRGSVGQLAHTLVDALSDDDPTLALDLERLDAIRRQRERLAAEYFRRNAAQWHTIRALHVEEAEVEDRLLGLISGAGVGDLLDIGTGTGRVIELLGPEVGRAVGIDLSHEMLTVARSNLERAQLRNCTVRPGNMYQLPIESRSVDAVTIHQVLHFAEKPEAVIAEAARVLRPEGQLIVVDFGKHSLEHLRDEHSHRWLGFDDEDLAHWCQEAGLEIDPPVSLPGEALNVGIWRARQPLQSAA